MNNSMLEQKLPINNDVKNMISNIGSGKHIFPVISMIERCLYQN